MGNSFLNSMKNLANEKVTENGAFALKSTRSGLIDLFGMIGAMRTRSEADIVNAFIKAYTEDRLLAMKMLFYARDIREGLGERDVTRVIFKYLANNHSEDIKVNLELMAEYGRWDDLYAFVGTPVESTAFAVMKSQYEKDLQDLKDGKSVSLLAKWLKSQNTSSNESKRLARLTAKYFYPEIEEFDRRAAVYRRNLSKLRAKIDIVESKMSAKEWGEINYENVPSKAASNYREAFVRNDGKRYGEYLSNVSKGTAKINAGALYPYEIIRPYSKQCRGWGSPMVKVDQTLEEQWKALPNYVTDKNFLIMADVSGSMSGLPMDVSVSLAIYFAERNKGAYHGQFMTFESTPHFIELPDGETLADKVSIVGGAPWGGSTNLKAAFDMILTAAVEGDVKPEDMPEALVVITDMEIDSYGMQKVNFTQTMKQKFEAAGYKMPVIVWWNVNARMDTFHAEYTDNSVRFVSGCSATVFKSLCENMGTTPEELMLMTLNSERYDAVKIA
jgi:hypothetical protein